MRRQSVPGHLSALGEWPGGEANVLIDTPMWAWSAIEKRSAFIQNSAFCLASSYRYTYQVIAIAEIAIPDTICMVR